MELSQIHGIGKKRIESLNAKDINNSLELVSFFPFQYKNMSQESTPSDFENSKEVLIRAKVITNPTGLYFHRIHTTKVTVQCENVKIVCMWFNQPYMKGNLVLDEEYMFFGKIKENKGKFTLLAPSFERADNNIRLRGLVAKYRKIEGIGSGILSNAIKIVLENEQFSSVIPENIEKKYSLQSLNDSFFKAHFPESLSEAENAVKRIEFEKVITLMLANLKLESVAKQSTKEYAKFDVVKAIERVLPFRLYSSQKTAIAEICDDMNLEKPMNRLLQGDVGSGKSVVMFAVALLVAQSKKQTAIMCPTTTLAIQHFSTLSKYSKQLGLKIGLMTSNSNGVATTLEELSSGEIDIIVGTHSLLSERVKFSKLGLVIIDEQQKFGVNQRAKLLEKGDNVDLLTVTATPIPRSLALIMYGDLRISYISKEIPENNIKTFVISREKTKGCYEFLKNELAKGGFLYVVCPKIYDEELTESYGAIEKYNEIKKQFKGLKVGILHGDLSVLERESVTQELMDDKLDVLVSTSIVEVGIDNARANLMLIFEAENFGLSSLHQLRGRIGRRGQESFCFLDVDMITELQNERLNFFKNNNDGFKIADYDLEIRGAGEYFGTMQHGKNGNEVFSKMTFEQLRLAKTICEEIMTRASSHS